MQYMPLVTILSSRDRFGPRPVMTFGITILFASLWQMGHFDLSMTAGPIELAGFIQGAGVGLIFNPLSVLCFAKLIVSSVTRPVMVAPT